MDIERIKRLYRYIIHGVPTKHITVIAHQDNSAKRLLDRNVIITGGSRGIGFAIAEKCIKEGAKVLICGRDEESLKQAVAKLGEKASCLAYNVADVSQANSFLNNCFEKLGGYVDCLVNNAGISYHETGFKDVTPNGFDEQFNVNFKGAYFLTQEYVKLIGEKKQTGGTILFISSERGSFNTDIPYGLSKATINSLTAALSFKFYGSKNIRVNAIAPGVTSSDMTGRKSSENMEYSASPIGRVLLPEEIAEVAVFLLSDYSRCISGEVVHCDAGAHLKCI